MHSPLVEPVLDSKKMGLEFLEAAVGSLSEARTAVSSA
jgi:hypothetical protein